MASSALFLNFYTTTLSASISSTATTMSVSSTTGLPSSLASGQFIPMILTSAAAPGTVYEIVYVTGISGSSLTITRGQEGTSALNWNASDIVFSSNTADTTGAQEGGTFSNPTITGGTISGATIPSGDTITNDGTISGGTITSATINSSNVSVGAVGTDNPAQMNQVPGQGQSGYNNVTSSRAIGTVYQNTTGRPLIVAVFIAIQGGSSGAIVGGPSSGTTINLSQWVNSYSGTTAWTSNAIIPPDWFYSVSVIPYTTVSQLGYWFEY